MPRSNGGPPPSMRPSARGGSLMPNAIRISPRTSIAVLAVVLASANPATAAQSVHEAPSSAPSSGRVAPAGEPGEPLTVSGIVVGRGGTAVAGASLYIYQTDREGYYGVKPAS